MSVVVLAAIAIVFMIVFFGGFSGFVLGDNTNNMLVLALAAVIPGAFFANLLNSTPAFILWASSYLLGVILADILKVGK